MNLRQILMLGTVFVVLFLGLLATDRREPARLTTEEYLPLRLAVDSHRIGKIEIGKGKRRKLVELERTKDAWKVANLADAPADRRKIKLFLKAIRGAKGELRGKDRVLFKDFGIAEDKAYRIGFLSKQGLPLSTLLIGTKRADYESVFLRKAGSDSVYYSRTELFAKMGIYGEPGKHNPSKDFWTALNLFRLKTGDVRRLEMWRLREDRKIFTAQLLKTASRFDNNRASSNKAVRGRWRYVRENLPFAIDQTKVEQYLDFLKTFMAQKVLDPKARDYALDEPDWELVLDLKRSEDVHVKAHRSGRKTIHVQVSTSPMFFKIMPYAFQDLDIDDSKFFESNPFRVSDRSTEKIFIRSNREKVTLNPMRDKRKIAGEYLDSLKNFRVTRLLLGPGDHKKAKKKGRYWLEIRNRGEEPQYLYVGDMISGEYNEFACRTQDSEQVFAIAEDTFRVLFVNLDSLRKVDKG